jgi:uncharacterized Fe-S cluster-containing radical SAM superfamily protein
MSKALPITASEPTVAPQPRRSEGPTVELRALDQLWFQVAGTVCNLRCRHCFISCSPENHSHWFMSRDEVAGHLETSIRWGVKEYYFTGGEPFMNRDMMGILGDALALGPVTVLTNATLLPTRTVEGLRRLARTSPYTLELRVSIDGVTAEMNDEIRGAGTFDRALDAVGRLVAVGLLPIITTMQTWADDRNDEVLRSFRSVLAGVGYVRPRLKILPPLRIGAEARRDRPYNGVELVDRDMMTGYPEELLLCSGARLVTASGVWACPILLDYPSARLGDTLDEAATRPAVLAEQACFTCWTHGAICSNLPGFAADPA